MSESGLSMFNGMRVIESEWLMEPSEPMTERRTWRERLFTRPWRPFVRTRTVVRQIPYRGALRLSNGTLVIHPVTLRALREQLLTPGFRSTVPRG